MLEIGYQYIDRRALGNKMGIQLLEMKCISLK